MDNSIGVEVFDGQESLGDVESRQVDGQSAGVLQQGGTVSSLDVLHQHTQVLPRLEGAVEGDHEGVVGHREDVPLGEHLVHLVPQQQSLLVHLLQGEPLAGLPMSNQIDSPISTVADQLGHVVREEQTRGHSLESSRNPLHREAVVHSIVCRSDESRLFERLTPPTGASLPAARRPSEDRGPSQASLDCMLYN